MSAPGSRRLEYERVADELRSMIVTGELRPGDRLRIETPGGGGHGRAAQN
jgi:DNA-binding GntR family transcriptional regulator